MLSALALQSNAFMPATKVVSRPSVRSVTSIMQEAAPVEAMEEMPPTPPSFDVKSLAGVTEPLGFFDPIGFSSEASEGKIRFYREVELKHARVAMLASLGYIVAEQFHPLFGGSVDTPAWPCLRRSATSWRSSSTRSSAAPSTRPRGHACVARLHRGGAVPPALRR